MAHRRQEIVARIELRDFNWVKNKMQGMYVYILDNLCAMFDYF